VTSGLTGGEQLIVDPPPRLESGDEVQIAE
jgi:hypothetical protein